MTPNEFIQFAWSVTIIVIILGLINWYIGK
jgi:hypothetical protein